MKRVGIIALLHESNTFLDEPTTLEHFRSNVLATGASSLDAFRGSQHEVGGFIEGLSGRADVEIVGVFAARAMPYGAITSECWHELMQMLEDSLRASLPLDGLLVAPHGATVAVPSPDADGDWLQRVRRIAGPDVPMIGTLDLHANVSTAMTDSCDALFGYRTNPHLDQRERGLEAAHTMLGVLDGTLTPRMALAQLPLCVNIERQATSEDHGVRLWSEASRLQQQPGVLSVSCLYGFPYADVSEMGASVIAVTDHDSTLASQIADQMATFWMAMKSEFEARLISVDDAIRQALTVRQESPDRPVGLLEMGDNVGGGSPGDGTWITHGWLTSGSGKLLTVIADPEAVKAASLAGPGATIDIPVGGKIDPRRHGPPIGLSFRVSHLSDGQFSESEIRHGGYSRFDQGSTAVLESHQGITVIATTNRVAPMSLQQILSQGVKPEDFAVIVIKGVHAPVAAYAPVCSQLIRVNTDGVTTADLDRLTFRNLRWQQ